VILPTFATAESSKLHNDFDPLTVSRRSRLGDSFAPQRGKGIEEEKNRGGKLDQMKSGTMDSPWSCVDEREVQSAQGRNHHARELS
jgi:hypothetical protein